MIKSTKTISNFQQNIQLGSILYFLVQQVSYLCKFHENVNQSYNMEGTCLLIDLLIKRIFSDVILSSNFKMLFEEESGLECDNYTRMSFACHWYVFAGIHMSSVCHSYVLVCHSYIICIYSYVIRTSLVCTLMSLVCHSYVLVCHLYVIRMYSYVIRTSLVCTRLSFVSHSRALMSLVCHSYVVLPWQRYWSFFCTGVSL